MPLSEPAIARFRAANPYGSRARLVFELGLSTALRREDLARVPAEDVEAGELPLRTGKTGTPVIAAVTEHLILAMRAFRAGHPEHAEAFYALGAQGNGRPVHKRTISREFEAAAKRSGLTEHERIHALRYTAATRLFELGIHYDDIAKLTGHAMASMVRHYCKDREAAHERGARLAVYGDAPYRPSMPTNAAAIDPAKAAAPPDGVAQASLHEAPVRQEPAAGGSPPAGNDRTADARGLFPLRQPASGDPTVQVLRARAGRDPRHPAGPRRSALPGNVSQREQPG
jgi:hypothetical protein